MTTDKRAWADLERSRADAALRQNEERQTFLLALSDALRPLQDPLEIEREALQMLGEHLGISRAHVAHLLEDRAEVRSEIRGAGDPSVIGLHPYTEWSTPLELVRRGQSFVAGDAQSALITDTERERWGRFGIVSLACVPVQRQGVTVACLAVCDNVPRTWTPREVGFLQDIADRTFTALEHARAEAALRSSEEQFRTLFHSIDEGFCTIEVLFDAAGKPYDYRFLEINPAFVEQTGLADAVGRTIREYAPQHEAIWYEIYGRIARTGEPMRFEQEAAAIGRFYDVYAFRIGEPAAHKVAVLFNDIAVRKRAERNLAFLAEVSHDLARLTRIDETMAALGAKIGEHFAASRVAFGEVDEAQESIRVDHAWDRADLPAFRGVFRIRDFHSEDFQEACRAGRTYVVRDAATDGRVDPAALAELNVRAFVSVPLHREGRWVFQVTVFDPQPRDWRDDEIELIQEVTVRIWNRLELARAEERLRESAARRERREKNQLFIIGLDRRLGEHGHAEDIEQTAIDALGEFLGVARCYFAHIQGREEARVEREYRASPALPSVIATHRFVDYFSPEAVAQFATGHSFAVDDVATDPRTAISAQAYAALGIAAFVTASVFYQGEWVAVISATAPAPRAWQGEELELLREAAVRLYPMMERARAEKALRDSEARLASVFAALPLGVAFVDPQGKIVLANRKMEHYLPSGTVPSLDPGPARFRAWHPDGRPVEKSDFPGARALRGEAMTPGLEMLFTEDDGREVWTQVTAVPHLDAGGRVLGQTTVVTDIDALKRAQEQLRAADRRRREFLALLGHELRNPLAALDAGVQLLQSPRPKPESRAATLAVVAQQVSHMTRLIDDVLDLSRLERGKLQVKIGAAELDAVLRAAIQQTAGFAQARGSQVRYQPPSEPCPLRADAERLVQVFANLLANALKFSAPGATVDLAAECLPKTVVVEVRDYGQGIALEDLAEIFEPFVQSKFSLGLPEEGLGLGLSVSRELVELHGGKITAQSAGLDQGSTFTVTLPRAASE